MLKKSAIFCIAPMRGILVSFSHAEIALSDTPNALASSNCDISREVRSSRNLSPIDTVTPPIYRIYYFLWVHNTKNVVNLQKPIYILRNVEYNKSIKSRREEYKMTLTLRQARRLREKSQEELARQIGVHVNTYRKLEENPDTVTIAMAKRISQVLGISYDEIFFAS
jgi:DNA-binding XRE family transcriptional regulator